MCIKICFSGLRLWKIFNLTTIVKNRRLLHGILRLQPRERIAQDHAHARNTSTSIHPLGPPKENFTSSKRILLEQCHPLPLAVFLLPRRLLRHPPNPSKMGLPNLSGGWTLTKSRFGPLCPFVGVLSKPNHLARLRPLVFNFRERSWAAVHSTIEEILLHRNHCTSHHYARDPALMT